MFQVRTVPADRVRGLLAIVILPMALCIHRLSVPNLVNHKPIGNEAAVKNIRVKTAHTRAGTSLAYPCGERLHFYW